MPPSSDLVLTGGCAQNHVKFAAQAGTALLFDTSCWHTPMPNTSAAPRRVYNAGFAASSGGQATTPWDIAELIPPARLTAAHPPDPGSEIRDPGRATCDQGN